MIAPAQIIVPELYGDWYATISWSQVSGAQRYILRRDTISGSGGTASMYRDTADTTYLDFLPADAASANYAVRAWSNRTDSWDDLSAEDHTWDEWAALGQIWAADISEWTESGYMPVEPALPAPPFIEVPLLHAGYPALIRWTYSGAVTGIELWRRFDFQQDFVLLGNRLFDSYEDYIPENVKTATYRIKSYASRGITWTELDAQGLTWDQKAEKGETWRLQESPWATYSMEVIPNRPPVISGQDGDLGVKLKGFTITFSATDPDPGNTITLRATLDGTQVFHMPDAQQGVNYTVTITDDQVFAWPDGSVHAVVITATDNKGAASTRRYTFTAVEDLVSTAVYYVLRDDEPVAKVTGATQWQDYMAVGVHRYRIRTVDKYDNYTDSNEVTVEIIVNGSTLALSAAPADYLAQQIRRGERPGRSGTQSVLYGEQRYEGRVYPVLSDSGQRSNQKTADLTTRTKAEENRLEELVNAGQPLIYRDLYDKRIIGGVMELPSDYYLRERHRDDLNYIVDFTLSIIQCDYSEVVPYD